MMSNRYLQILAATTMFTACAPIAANAENFNIPSGDLDSALESYSAQSGVQLMVPNAAVHGIRTKGVRGDLSDGEALTRILSGTGFTSQRDETGVIGIVRERHSQSEVANIQIAQAASTRAPVETVTVTSSKLGGADVQSVPIAITAMSQEQLTATQTAGGPDLVKQVPNLTFTKTNFTGYSISIRGIGTQAVSVTTDPAVAVSFNDTAFIRNHFFEQEFFDVSQVEVLRGPQGTLYGRNATAGVVNIVSAKPTDSYEAMASIDVGNYENRRMEGMLNIPVVGDKLGIRAAGEWTKRDGYAFNDTTQNSVDGRDLWSSRVTVGIKPFERLQAYAIWEHFNEDDNRARSTKQLCHHDYGPSSLTANGVTVDNIEELARGYLSQGCLPGSLYDAGAYGTPNGLSIPFIQAAADPTAGNIGIGYPDPTAGSVAVTAVLPHTDPYGNMMQSPNLRVINSVLDPKYKAKSDVFEVNVDYSLTPELTLTSQTGYGEDRLYSFEDFNRFNTVPIFADSSNLDESQQPYAGFNDLTPNGVFCDPQIGCSKSIAGFDISQEHSIQFNQELRLASSFSGPLNFSVGANYTRYRTLEDYYVLFNLITLLAESEGPLGGVFNTSSDPTKCTPKYPGVLTSADKSQVPVPIGSPESAGCIYIDTNPVDKINGEGHNYFRSENPYILRSWAGFGEVYYQATPDVKITAGLRYTSDNKDFTPVPSQTLLSSTFLLSGTVDRGYPALPDIKQHWGEFTGRLVANWSPKLDFTDQSMFYASYSRGYKGGGSNPPGIGYNPQPIGERLIGPGYCDPDTGPGVGTTLCNPIAVTLSYPKIFKPEFVNAYEAGSKNTLLDGSLVLNGDAFYYDYKNYQVSQIKGRTAVNENFSAKVWGAEVEGTYEPLPGLRFNFAGGYEGSRIDNGMLSIDLMDRTAGNQDYVVERPFLQLSDSCIVPKSAIVDQIVYNRSTSWMGSNENDYVELPTKCGGYLSQPLNPFNAPNGGAGIYKDLGGNELPNSPHFTLSFGAQYSMPLSEDWAGTLRGDFYAQTNSWARVYNDDPYDRLHGYTNMNLSLIFTNQDGWQAMVYVKNVFDTTAITGAFLNSDDTALSTNVFVTDPRLFGIRITKNW